ncbi:uncharacterized protein KY384_003216 [Bacidia gigantensis]|uniref:uncharacterized protein n=1 Tax=Bacidia gigantensis TaxID=2732470 RepID=UPI001D052B66|nr:uncharacterized protein KY384_003216 [Bacidia gigantensis]KAG8531586.1 hypothetical protein KY384_003216 [Bacidia gigantensis]
MAPSPNPEQSNQRLNLSHLPQISATQPQSGSSTANTSPIDSHPSAASRSPFGNPPGKTAMSSTAGVATSRNGAGSPSHDLGTARPYSKRAREIQASEGLTPQFWGPPASGGSTPLRETIPESPSQDGFPDFLPPSDSPLQGTTRRPRAGTVPSRLSPAAPPGLGSISSSQSKSSRPTPSTSPFRSSSFMGSESPNSTSALLSRLRAGSMPQQKKPRRNQDGLTDTDVKTLDYLGLAETPRQNQANLVQPLLQGNGLPPYFNDIATMNRNLSRLRSFSVNAKEKYADDEEDQYTQNGAYSGQNSGIVTPMDAALAQTRAQIHHHNLAVQAFASQASANRPRARTAGVLDSPLRPAPAPIRLPTTRPRQISNAIPGFDWSEEYEGLPEAVQAMNLNTIARRPTLETLDDSSQDKPTRALWLGNIPTSTTTSSLEALFGVHGKIESSRVLMHKNCGFVNFEHVDSARLAKATLNGKEIFPGAGPVKIGYAKEPNSSSVGGTPGNFQSRSPDPFSRGQTDFSASQAEDDFGGDRAINGTNPQASAALEVPSLAEAKADILQMAHEFGATADDRYAIEDSIISAQAFTSFEDEIPQVPEPSQNRLYDAPRLRDIRKRIDNSSMAQSEIEETAMAMLPEVAELSSDYLGNTVVQKLFEFCSESIKEQMLAQVAPHLAQIGVHKNGTWAAQKIIDVCKISNQKQILVDCLRPYTVALFLDQYGNYVLQGCLRFGAPHNNFIFETMLSRMWDIAQGRFGARAMRACLESHHATRSQQRMLAAAIVLHSVKLATNANGALLLTWFLDTCTLQHKRTALAPKLVPHLVHLCTHKVAYLTVLKVINQRNEVEAREIVLQALFSEDGNVLEEILSDQQCGATLIFKVLTTPCFDESQRNDVLQKVRNVLIRLKASPSQGYKRLMDEVGLSVKSNKGERDLTPNSHASHQERPRSTLHGTSRDRRHHHPDNGRQYNDNHFLQSPPQQPYAMQTGFSGTSAMDPNDLLAYDQMPSNYPTNTLNGLSYQQAMLGRDNSPGGFYPNVGIGGYPATSAGMNQLPQRALGVGPNPMMQQNGYSQPGMNPMMGYNNMPGFQQFPMQYAQQQPLMQADMRGRRVFPPVKIKALQPFRLTTFFVFAAGKRDAGQLSTALTDFLVDT